VAISHREQRELVFVGPIEHLTARRVNLALIHLQNNESSAALPKTQKEARRNGPCLNQAHCTMSVQTPGNEKYKDWMQSVFMVYNLSYVVVVE
jgi:hypothetical protein